MDELLGEFWRRPQRLSNLNTLHFADSWPVTSRGVLFVGFPVVLLLFYFVARGRCNTVPFAASR